METVAACSADGEQKTVESMPANTDEDPLINSVEGGSTVVSTEAPAAMNGDKNSLMENVHGRDSIMQPEGQWQQNQISTTTNAMSTGVGSNLNFHGKPVVTPPGGFRSGRGGGNIGHINRGGARIGSGHLSGRPHDTNWPSAQHSAPSSMINGPQVEFWVETKTDDGKSYFYHALTRETTWNKPEGPNVKIMTQVEIEDMNKKQQQMQQFQRVEGNDIAFKPGDVSSVHGETKEQKLKEIPPTSAAPSSANASEVLTAHPPPNILSQAPLTPQTLTQPPPNVTAVTAPSLTQQPPPALHQQPPPFFPQGMHPPNFSQPPFGMPPPGYGGFPGGPAPWAIHWNQHMHSTHAASSQQEKPAKNLIIKPGVIDPAVIARAAEWSEHRAPDGRPYYYHAARGESVWEKPQALRDMEAARMAAHSGATPQQASMPPPPVTMPPHILPNAAMLHMPPVAGPGYDPAMAYNVAAAAVVAVAATLKTNDAVKAVQGTVEKEAKKADEKRKKEDDQKKTPGSSMKPIDKSRPISSTPIAGTPWCVVWTGDARVFFYNPSSRTSVWERPEELLDRVDVDKAVNNPPEQLKNITDAGNEKSTEKGDNERAKQVLPMEEEDELEDVEVIKIRTESESSVEEVPTKKTKISLKQTKKADAIEAAVEAEVRAAKERAVVPLETRVKQFKEMLREKDVSAFSTWEKELHKIVFDPRYLLLTSKERKQVFEKYVKDRAEEERKEKRHKMRQKREDFRKLMEDAKLHGKSSFSDFCQRSGKDERYKAIEKVRERESLFNEFIVDVRRHEKEEKLQKKEQIRRDFIEMLRERSDIDRHTRWHDIKKKFDSDHRYRAVDNSMYREEYFQDFMRQLKEEKRKQREQKDRERDREKERERERERERDRKPERKRGRSERSRSKERDRNDKDKNKDTDWVKEKEEEKEKDNNKNGEKKRHEKSDEGEHQDNDEQSVNSEDDEIERLQKERERQLRAEQSIREREKEVQRALAGHLRDRDKEREHHKRDEAIGHFNALLTDLVRNPDLTWKEVKRQLRKDHRWELIETLDRDDREKIFNEHIDALMKKKREKFREMLDEITTLELTSSWKDIKKQVKEDPRYLKYNNSDKCEREFRDYIKDKTLAAKAALRELLQECKLITHKSIDMVKENPNHLKEIQEILRNDKRYLILEHMEEERTTIVVNYLEELHKRGPPPPPTASESTRRNK